MSWNTIATSRALAGTSLTTDAVDQHLARGDRLEPGDHPQHGRLAATRRADEHEELTVLDGEVDPVDRLGAVGVDLAEIASVRASPCETCRVDSRAGPAWPQTGLGANMVTWRWPTIRCLQPYQLKHLTLRNRVFSSSHEPAYSRERHAQGPLPAVSRREGQGRHRHDDDRRLGGRVPRTARRRSATCTPTRTRSCRSSGA